MFIKLLKNTNIRISLSYANISKKKATVVHNLVVLFPHWYESYGKMIQSQTFNNHLWISEKFNSSYH